jgi:hypothetical protein
LCFLRVIFCFGVGRDLGVGVGAVFRFVGCMTLGLDIGIGLCVDVGLHLANFLYLGLTLGRNVGVSMSWLRTRLSRFLGYDKG